MRSYDDWLVAGQPALSFEAWDALPSEEKHQFSQEEIRDLAEDPTTDWTGEQHHRAERYIIDYERERLGGDWSPPILAEKFVNNRQRGELHSRQETAVVLPLDVPDYDWPDPATIPPRAWLHDKHYMRQVVTATASPGGYGKTSKSLYDAIDMTAKGLNVWYISGEDPKKEIDLRIAAHCQHRKIDHAKLSGALTVVDAESYPIIFGTEKNQALIFDEPQLAALEATIKLKKIDVVIFDPLISFFVGSETNKILHQVVKRFPFSQQLARWQFWRLARWQLGWAPVRRLAWWQLGRRRMGRQPVGRLGREPLGLESLEPQLGLGRLAGLCRTGSRLAATSPWWGGGSDYPYYAYGYGYPYYNYPYGYYSPTALSTALDNGRACNPAIVLSHGSNADPLRDWRLGGKAGQSSQQGCVGIGHRNIALLHGHKIVLGRNSGRGFDGGDEIHKAGRILIANIDDPQGATGERLSSARVEAGPSAQVEESFLELSSCSKSLIFRLPRF